jgi:hypothetical protein
VNPECHVVKSEWFWNSIQIQAAADVSAFKWREAGLLSPIPNKSVFSPPTPSSLASSRNVDQCYCTCFFKLLV